MNDQRSGNRALGFGMVYVDFATQKRTVKDSAYWYKHVMETNGEEL